MDIALPSDGSGCQFDSDRGCIEEIMGQTINGNPFQWQTTYEQPDGTSKVVRSPMFIENNPNTAYTVIGKDGFTKQSIYCPYIPKTPS